MNTKFKVIILTIYCLAPFACSSIEWGGEFGLDSKPHPSGRRSAQPPRTTAQPQQPTTPPPTVKPAAKKPTKK